MKFYLLASGSKGNCFLLQDEHLNVLVDCGSTKKYLLSAFDRIGFSLKDLDAVLITHTHTDHISQIKTFKDYPVYSPVEIDKIDTIRVESEVPFQLQHVTIRPLALSHDAEKTTGYIFETWLEKLVYITDTGYVKDKYLPLLTGADYIILESNHDIEKLMCTSRPYYVKQRIASDSGHLCNEDAANILDKIVTEKTKMIVLAHISEEANTREKALEVTCNTLMKHRGSLNKELVICSAGQFEIEHGGDNCEKNILGTCYRAIGMEYYSNR